ncbi:type II toxin-antitoxin system VapC family toxin [Pelagibacterium halotolerans]|uniref:type II toxin-antitoxin system VapC family toxin n=1 Tax=Pelagibacterium halotolerans TaxID=531813 RepID=UPI00384CE6E7
MMEYLLDTNAVIDLIGRRSDALWRRIEDLAEGALGVSSIVAHELYFGAYKSERIAFNLETLRLLFADISVLDYDGEDARVAGEIRAELKRAGSPIGPYDVLIAGQAKARGMTLITRNTGEFQRVSGLCIEDWD